jgi:crossover junction endodeoxyribonuclease RusA
MKTSVSFPPPILNPNTRKHWALVAKAKKTYRRDAHISALADGICKMTGVTSCKVRITFTAPDARARDRDNMIAAFKSGQDGIADAIGIDDALWVPSYHVNRAVAPGKVEVEFLSFSRGRAVK